MVDTLQRGARKYNADGFKRKTMSKRMTNWNKVKQSPAQLTPQMADILRDNLRADNLLLSELLNRDPGH